MKALKKVSVVLFAVLALNVNAKVNDTVEKSFDLTGKGQLLLENINGDVDIESWSEQRVKVTANISAKNQESRDRIKINTKQSGNRISVETEYEQESGSWGHNNNGGSVDYVIMVPQTIDLRKLEVINGSLTIKQVAGELNADVINGKINASGLASDINVDSINGAVELSLADTAKNIDIEVETVNGSIRVYVPKDFGAKVEASSGNGSIKTDFGIQGTKGKYYGNDLEGNFGDASSNIRLESVNGSIKVLKL